MLEKEELARYLLSRGLNIQQICAQLNCSRGFVRRIKKSGEVLQCEAKAS